MNSLYKVKSFETWATFNSHYMSSFNHFRPMRDVTFHVSVVGFCLKLPGARSCGCDVMTISTNPEFFRHATDAGFLATRALCIKGKFEGGKEDGSCKSG
ncbi:MAG: hypothetical protein PV344_05395, partial [Anaplasma sp.]|nr:hypothetical protein [Anaplasma sp.]